MRGRLKEDLDFELTNLFEHSKEHLSAVITECWSLVAVDDEAVGPDLDILIPQGLSVEDQLNHGPLLNIRHGVNCLK